MNAERLAKRIIAAAAPEIIADVLGIDVVDWPTRRVVVYKHMTRWQHFKKAVLP